MRRTRHTLSGSWSGSCLTALLGAVLCGCAFFVPAVGAADGITVEIIKPDRDPFAFDVGREYEFEAVAFVEGQELPGGQVTWDWNFGDDTPHSADNPAHHTYSARGAYTVTVAASYGGLSGQDTLSVQAVAAGTGDLFMGFQLIARASLGHNFGGTVCDQVEIAVRAPTPVWPQWAPPFTAQFYRNQWPIGNPVSNTGEQDGGTTYSVAICPSVWPSAYDRNGMANHWTATVTVHVGEPPPFGYDEYWNVSADFTPDNLVITAGGPLIIEHHQGETNHALTWTSDHLWFPAVGTTYQATVEVYDMSGSLVVTSPFVNSTINQQGSWDWHPNFGGPPPGNDTDGLYAFRITGQHGPGCTDSDKVDMLSEVRVPAPANQNLIHIDWDTLTLKGEIEYTASGELASPVLHIYGPTSTTINLPTAAGHHVIPYELPIGYGSFRAAITATQTPEQATANRGGDAKEVIPEGCWLGSIPGPPEALEIYEPHHPPAANFKFCFEPCEPRCTIRAKGRVVDYPQYNGGLHWDIDPIAGSTLEIIPASSRTPDIQFTYHDLPDSNSQFGPKTLTLSHPLVPSAQCTLKIFFCQDGFNHPNQPQPIATPNWYYYWCQGVVPALTSFIYNPFETHLGKYIPGGNLYIGDGAVGAGPEANGPTWLATNHATQEQWLVGGSGSRIDMCAEICAHELQHMSNYQNASGQPDFDGDGLSDAFESASPYHLNLFDPDTYGMHEKFPDKPDYLSHGDDEFLAFRAELTPVAVNAAADWSNPGNNGYAQHLEY